MNNVKVRLNKKGVGKLLKSKELAAPTRAVAEVRAESYAARKENADTNSILKALK